MPLTPPEVRQKNVMAWLVAHQIRMGWDLDENINRKLLEVNTNLFILQVHENGG